jgi:uncharacterized protein
MMHIYLYNDSMVFEWDENKALRNQKVHGVTFGEAATVFDDPLHLTEADEAHSIDEQRFVTVGMSVYQRLVLVVHTDEEEIIRIISARRATKGEREDYESGF